jgi:hypothetical protein
LFVAAAAVQDVCRERDWGFCFIGGLGVLRWGEPRLTRDIDLTILAGFGAEAAVVDGLFQRFEARIDDARQFAIRNRVALLKAANGVPIDVALGALDFEQRAVERASLWDVKLADAITALVAEKRAVGYKYAAEQQMLARFAAFCRSVFRGPGAPTQASVEAWIAAARRRAVAPATLQALAAPVRELARWLGRRGVPAYVLPAGALPRPARYIPHIYTDQELAALFTQTDRCHYCSHC